MYRQVNIRPTTHINIRRSNLIDRESGRIGIHRVIGRDFGSGRIETSVEGGDKSFCFSFIVPAS